LDDAGKKSIWTVQSTIHTPSAGALRDGGYQAARESLEVTWAAPLEGAPRGVGTFWAYFPTAELTTLSGIVNAAWKLADDRESLLPGLFNEEILTHVLPRLVVSALPSLCRPERPAPAIDVLPARGREARGYADDVINQPLMKAVADTRCIPNLTGDLRHPRRVNLHPDKLDADELTLWASACTDPENWVHHSLNSPERRAKVVRILAIHQRVSRTYKEWVEHLVKDPTVEGSAAAVRLVAALSQRMPDVRKELESARVLLLDDGTVHACRRGQVFLPGSEVRHGRLIIDPVLAADPNVESALRSLGIEIFDNAGELRSELSASEIKWDRVWSSARKNSTDEAESIIREILGDEVLRRLRVRTYSGHWKEPGAAFLPGPVIPGDGSRDRDFVVDHRFHGQDLNLLERLGLVTQPRRMSSPPLESWRRAREADVRDQFRRQVGQARISDESVDIDAGRALWPLDFLSGLTPAGRAAVVQSALRQLSGDEHWTISRRTGGNRFKVPDPVWTHLRTYGCLPTVIGVQPVTRCLVDGENALVDGVEQPLPFITAVVDDAQAKALRLKSNVQDLRAEDWDALIDQASGWTHERRFLLYAWAAYCEQPAPAAIKVQRGPGHIAVPPSEAAVTSRKDVFDSLLAANVPAVFARAEDANILQDAWGLADGGAMLVETLEAHPSGEAVRAIDRFPPLRHSLDAQWHDLEIQPCARLDLLTSTPTGQLTRALTSRLDGKTLFTAAVRDRDVLLEITRELDTSFKPDTVLRRMEEQRLDKLRVEIADTPDLLDKLLLAIGPKALHAAIPSSALDALRDEIGHDLDDRDVARLSIAVDGYGILQRHVPDLTRAGLDPPGQWAGRRPAREWARRLGFPVEFAGFPGAQREAESEVEGPPRLGELHDYQVPIAQRIRGLLGPEAEVRRGLVALPTGAGKTRVAVQALVEHIAAVQRDVRIVWVAETDELCEQAIQTWSQVWRATGVPGHPLTLSRLWSGNEVNERDGAQVVVTSVAKLFTIMKRAGGNWEVSYGWLQRPEIIVVDEAHKSIGSQYTEVLSGLGGAKRVADITTPLLGLTATPFRGFNNEETKALAGRYHRNLLDEGVFPNDDVYGFLQEEGYLARVRHEQLEGAEVTLTDQELKDAQDWSRVPESVERRLGQDEKRNNSIIRSLMQLDADATALLFATSVENARVLAALLSYRGIESRAVSGDTDPSARRRYIEDFKARRVRVLTNYNVFTEGFDVPRVDAVYITRPTFSPNVYQQMVGRGLRGPRNGGKEAVHIVNVADNLTNYGQKLAFHHFDHLWGMQRRE
jgi:superfamily II DNA or RNA helicase